MKAPAQLCPGAGPLPGSQAAHSVSSPGGRRQRASFTKDTNPPDLSTFQRPHLFTQGIRISTQEPGRDTNIQTIALGQAVHVSKTAPPSVCREDGPAGDSCKIRKALSLTRDTMMNSRCDACLPTVHFLPGGIRK